MNKKTRHPKFKNLTKITARFRHKHLLVQPTNLDTTIKQYRLLIDVYQTNN